MKNRKYPLSLFVFGTILNLIKIWYWAAISLLFLFAHIFNPTIPFWFPIIFLVVWLIIALVRQLKDREILLSKSDNEGINNLFDKAFDQNNPNWRKTLTDFVDEKIKEYENVSQSK